MKRYLNKSSNLTILTPKGRNNQGIFRLLLGIGWSATLTNGRRSTLDANAGGAAKTSGDRYTYTQNKENNAPDRNISNGSTIKRRTINRNGQASSSNTTVDTWNKAFEGSELDIGCVLGLWFEKMGKKVAYDVFYNRFTYYIFRTVKYGVEVVCDVEEYKDLMTDMKGETCPKTFQQ